MCLTHLLAHLLTHLLARILVHFGWIEGKMPIGRPRKTWIDPVRDDLRVASDLNNKRGAFFAWRTLAQDKGQGRDLIHSLVDTHLIFGMGSCCSSSSSSSSSSLCTACMHYTSNTGLEICITGLEIWRYFPGPWRLQPKNAHAEAATWPEGGHHAWAADIRGAPCSPAACSPPSLSAYLCV